MGAKATPQRITVRDLTTREIEELRRLAHQHSRSLAGEIRFVLRSYLAQATSAAPAPIRPRQRAG